VQMHNLLTKILARKATARDLEKLEELCEMVKCTSLCGLGQTAPNPVLSTLRFFRNEYTELLQEDIYGGPNRNGNGHTNGNGKETKEEFSPMI
jgi:bidirectional [NiFe] hydrogenase diaphorase subunit